MSKFIESLYGHFFSKREAEDYKKKLTIEANFLGLSKLILESLAKMPSYFSSLTFEFIQKEEESDKLNILISEPNQTLDEGSNRKLIFSNCFKNVEDARYISFQRHLLRRENLEVIRNRGGVSLGEIRSDIHKVEPLIRDVNEVIFYPDCIRASDLAFLVSSVPSGLLAEEACQLFKFLGGANHLRKVTFPLSYFSDWGDQWLPLYCELLWYFLEGLEISIDDHPAKTAYQTFFVTNPSYDLEFVQSDRSGRWWMKNGNAFYPCSQKEYTDAANGNLPTRLSKLL